MSINADLHIDEMTRDDLRNIAADPTKFSVRLDQTKKGLHIYIERKGPGTAIRSFFNPFVGFIKNKLLGRQSVTTYNIENILTLLEGAKITCNARERKILDIFLTKKVEALPPSKKRAALLEKAPGILRTITAAGTSTLSYFSSKFSTLYSRVFPPKPPTDDQILAELEKQLQQEEEGVQQTATPHEIQPATPSEAKVSAVAKQTIQRSQREIKDKKTLDELLTFFPEASTTTGLTRLYDSLPPDAQVEAKGGDSLDTILGDEEKKHNFLQTVYNYNLILCFEREPSCSIRGTSIDDQAKSIRQWLKTNAKNITDLNCNGVGLTCLPDELQKCSLKTLHLANNKLTHFPEVIKELKGSSGLFGLRSTPGLKELDISGNDLSGQSSEIELPKSLTKISFARCSLPSDQLDAISWNTIQSVDLSGNKLKAIPSSLSSCTHLQELFLQDNEIQKLDEDFFISAKCKARLQTIDLSDNFLTEMPSLEGLTSLNSLLLRNNLFAKLDLTGAAKTRLSTLDISGNPLTEFPETLQDITTLEHLSMRSMCNTHQSGPLLLTALVKPDKSIAKTDGAALHNSMKVKWERLSQRLSRLQSFDLSGNALFDLPQTFGRNLPSLTSLRLNNNNVTLFSPNIEWPEGLTLLDLSQNHLTEVPDEIFFLSHLHSLTLRGNQIAKLNPTDKTEESAVGMLHVQSLPQIQDLDLSDNLLKAIPPMIYTRAGLISANFSGNMITEVPEDIKNLSSLKSLDLSRNLISTCPQAFWNMGSLESLRLAHNKFRTIKMQEKAVTEAHPRLKELDLSNNQITSLTLWQFPELTHVNLSRNKLDRFPQSLIQQSSVRFLDLSHNELTTLPPGIQDLAWIEDFSLAGNKIEEISLEIGTLKTLTHLDLSDNKLSRLPNTFRGLRSLHSLLLGGNTELTSLPNSMWEVPLRSLSIQGTKISSLSPDAAFIPGFQRLEYTPETCKTPLPFPDEATAQITLPTKSVRTEVPAPISPSTTTQPVSFISSIDSLSPEGQYNALVKYFVPDGKTLDQEELTKAYHRIYKSLPEELQKQLPKLDDIKFTQNDSLHENFNKIFTTGYQYSLLKLLGGTFTAKKSLSEQVSELLKPEKIADIQTLDINTELGITCLPEEIGYFSNLETLSATNLKLTYLPETIGQLTKLTTLNLQHNRIQTIPPSIKSLVSLTQLNVSHNALSAIPDAVGSLLKLRQVHLSNNGIEAVPASLQNLQEVEELNLSNNKVSKLPDISFENLLALESLSLSGNLLHELPTKFSNIPSLKDCDLSNNPLHDFPPIPSSVQKLSLHNCRLRSLPLTIRSLARIRDINLSENMLSDLPPTLGELQSTLQHINIERNQFTRLPSPILELKNLRTINALGNSIDVKNPSLWSYPELPTCLPETLLKKKERSSKSSEPSGAKAEAAQSPLTMTLSMTADCRSVRARTRQSLQPIPGGYTLTARGNHKYPTSIRSYSKSERFSLLLSTINPFVVTPNKNSAIQLITALQTALPENLRGGLRPSEIVERVETFHDFLEKANDYQLIRLLEGICPIPPEAPFREQAEFVHDWLKDPQNRPIIENMKFLSCKGKDLVFLPPEIAQFKSLECLDLSDNQLITLPKELGQLTKLRKLDLANNRLVKLPPEIGNLLDLTTLHLENQGEILNGDWLTWLRSCFTGEDSLSSSDTSTSLTKLPSELTKLTKLEELDISRNKKITSLPQTLGNLSLLQRLNISDTGIKQLPSLKGLEQLEELDVSNIQGFILPKDLSELKKLIMLHASHIGLASITPDVTWPETIRNLFLNGNTLSKLPPAILEAKHLVRLNLDHNVFVDVPLFPQRSPLKILSLQGNKVDETKQTAFRSTHQTIELL